MPNFASLLNKNAPLTGLHASLITLFDSILSSGKVTDPVQLNALARVRAQLDIALKGM